MFNNKINYISLLVILFIAVNTNAAINDPTTNKTILTDQLDISYISDGPYIFYEKETISVKWIKNNHAFEKKIRNDNIKFLHRYFGLNLQTNWILNERNISPQFNQEYKGVKNLIAISDVHGQYDLFIKLLLQYKVVDKKLNWIFGSGHLVVLGDIMDRGPKVTEALWLVYQLEKQAEQAGGKVHFLLGNHELMVINNDARYINAKYLESSRLLETTYDKLFSENTLLGSWLRKRPVMVKINDILFVHAGISVDFIKQGLNIEESNTLFINKIIGNTWDNILRDSTLTFMAGDLGPIWYRGYFTDLHLKEYQIDHILKYFDSKHIIVGHTSLPNITSIYDKKIIGIDSNIKMGDYGELLIYKNDEFYRGTTNGNLIGF
jgi:hypothetical protein